RRRGGATGGQHRDAGAARDGRGGLRAEPGRGPGPTRKRLLRGGCGAAGERWTPEPRRRGARRCARPRRRAGDALVGLPRRVSVRARSEVRGRGAARAAADGGLGGLAWLARRNRLSRHLVTRPRSHPWVRKYPTQGRETLGTMVGV